MQERILHVHQRLGSGLMRRHMPSKDLPQQQVLYHVPSAMLKLPLQHIDDRQLPHLSNWLRFGWEVPIELSQWVLCVCGCLCQVQCEMLNV